MPKIQKKSKIEQCTKIFIYRDLNIARIFQKWLTPIGWTGALSQSERVKYFERIS